MLEAAVVMKPHLGLDEDGYYTHSLTASQSFRDYQHDEVHTHDISYIGVYILHKAMDAADCSH